MDRRELPTEPAENDGVRVNARLVIPRAELTIRVSRSGGAGGQHVNKTSTRVELVWNVATSAAPTDTQRALLIERLASKLSADGELRIVSSETRSQLQNRELAEERLAAIVRGALVIPKVRKATKPSRAAKEARLQSKKKITEKKRDRRWRAED